MRYPTDEELWNLIEYLEAEPLKAEPLKAELLYAPPHLKADILKKVEQIAIPSSGLSHKWWRINFAYNIKIAAGMAAALILIFTLPQDFRILSWQEKSYEQWVDVSKYEDEQLYKESEFSRIFRISATAMHETNSLILDKINIFDLFETRGESYEDIKKE